MAADFHEQLLNGLRKFASLDDLRRSDFFARHAAGIHALLETPEIFHHPATDPRQRPFLRIVQWNIEKGKQYGRILESLRENPVLRRADVILLNEADFGMNRSGSIHVARNLACDLGMHMAFGPAHLELTRGTEEDLQLPGENRESLQGNAVLSRYPILEAHVVPLPVCFEPYGFHEKRYGWRNCIWAKVGFNSGYLWFGSVHLEVRNTPGCRARQMKHILENLPGEPEDHYLLGGDFNSNGFARGTTLRTLKSAVKVVLADPEKLRAELRHPESGREPLFPLAKEAGFTWRRLNSEDATSSAPISGLEDASLLPAFVAEWIRRRLATFEGYLDFKLDWFLGKGIQAVKSGEIFDRVSNVASADPGCVPLPRKGPDRITDHNPIFVDISIWGSLP
jgi:endonuclease/exonuclease/phosphatase family metal-dependent hydrolase